MAQSRSKAPDTGTLLDETRTEIGRLTGRLGEIAAERDAALLADDRRAVEGLEAEAETVKTEIGRRERRLALLQEKAAAEAKASAEKQRAEQIERVADLLRQRAAGGIEIEKAVAGLLAAVKHDMALTKQIAAAWPWDNSDRALMRFYGVGIRALLCYELYRQSAMAFLGEVGQNAIALPGSVCPRDDWRLQPDKIPSLANTLAEIAEYGSSAMRGTPLRASAPPPAPKPEAPAPVKANGVSRAPQGETISPTEALLRAHAEAESHRAQFKTTD